MSINQVKKNPFAKAQAHKTLSTSTNVNVDKKDATRENVKKQLLNALDVNADAKISNLQYTSEKLSVEIEENIFKQNGNVSQSKGYRDKIRKFELRIKGTRNAYIREILKKGLLSVNEFCALDDKTLNDESYFKKLIGNESGSNVNNNIVNDGKKPGSMKTHKTAKPPALTAFHIPKVMKEFNNDGVHNEIKEEDKKEFRNDNTNKENEIKEEQQHVQHVDNSSNNVNDITNVKDNGNNIFSNEGETITNTISDINTNTNVNTNSNTNEPIVMNDDIIDKQQQPLTPLTNIEQQPQQQQQPAIITTNNEDTISMPFNSTTSNITPSISHINEPLPLHSRNNKDIFSTIQPPNKTETEPFHKDNNDIITGPPSSMMMTLSTIQEPLSKSVVLHGENKTMSHSKSMTKFEELKQKLALRKKNPPQHSKPKPKPITKPETTTTNPNPPPQKISIDLFSTEPSFKQPHHNPFTDKEQTTSPQFIESPLPNNHTETKDKLSSSNKLDFITNPESTPRQKQQTIPIETTNTDYFNSRFENSYSIISSGGLKEKYKQLNEAKIALETELELKKKENETLLKEITLHKKTIEELRNNKSKSNEELLQLELLKLQQIIKNKNTEIERLSNDNIKLNNQIKSYNESYSSMMNNFTQFKEQAEKRFSAYQKEIELLRMKQLSQQNTQMNNVIEETTTVTPHDVQIEDDKQKSYGDRSDQDNGIPLITNTISNVMINQESYSNNNNMNGNNYEVENKLINTRVQKEKEVAFYEEDNNNNIKEDVFEDKNSNGNKQDEGNVGINMNMIIEKEECVIDNNVNNDDIYKENEIKEEYEQHNEEVKEQEQEDYYKEEEQNIFTTHNNNNENENDILQGGIISTTTNNNNNNMNLFNEDDVPQTTTSLETNIFGAATVTNTNTNDNDNNTNNLFDFNKETNEYDNNNNDEFNFNNQFSSNNEDSNVNNLFSTPTNQTFKVGSGNTKTTEVKTNAPVFSTMNTGMQFGNKTKKKENLFTDFENDEDDDIFKKDGDENIFETNTNTKTNSLFD